MTLEFEGQGNVTYEWVNEAALGDLPAWLYWGAPIASVLFCWSTPFLGYGVWYGIMGYHEQSFVEIATVALLLPVSVIGVIVSLRFFRGQLLPRKQALTVAAFMLIGALGALYFGGEEMSWGQSYFHWETPDIWGR